jgi:hypothetical protein
MAKSLNFNKVKKEYLTITLQDENNTVIMVLTPTKGEMTRLVSLRSSLESIKDDSQDLEALDELFEASATLMSRNKGGIKIDKKLLEKIWDYQDVLIFFNAYMEFVTDTMQGKN